MCVTFVASLCLTNPEQDSAGQPQPRAHFVFKNGFGYTVFSFICFLSLFPQFVFFLRPTLLIPLVSLYIHLQRFILFLPRNSISDAVSLSIESFFPIFFHLFIDASLVASALRGRVQYFTWTRTELSRVKIEKFGSQNRGDRAKKVEAARASDTSIYGMFLFGVCWYAASGERIAKCILNKRNLN